MSTVDPSGATGDTAVPPDVQAFLDQVIHGSLMRYDVLRFFYQNPYAILTISDLTLWMSLEERPLADALQQLGAMGFLSQSPASSAFVLGPDRARRRQIDDFFGVLDGQPDLARQVRLSLRRRLETKNDGI